MNDANPKPDGPATGGDPAAPAEALRRFAVALKALSPFPGTGREAALAGTARTLALLLESKALFEAEGGFAPPLIVVVTGGTNVGKSEVFNALIGARVSEPDPRAGMTRRPAVYVHEDERPRLESPLFLPGAGKEELRRPQAANEEDPAGRLTVFLRAHRDEGLRGLAIADSPDVDSNRPNNQEWARRLLAAADLTVFVTSPSKYNDEACVEFLARAAATGAEPLVAFNLLGPGSPRVVEDSRTHVWPAAAGSGTPRIARLPHAPGDVGAALAGPLEEVRGILRRAAGETGRVKRRRVRAAASYLAPRVRELAAALREEDGALEALRRDARAFVEGAREQHRRRLEGQEFLELEEVIRRVLEEFRVPVLDDVLSAPGKAFRWAAQRLSAGSGETAGQRIRERRESDRRWIRERVDALRLEILATLSRSPGPGLPATVHEALKGAGFDRADPAALDALLDQGDRETAAWTERLRQEIVSGIGRRPMLRRFLKSGRALLQVGSGVLLGALTGGFGASDLVLAPAGAWAVHFLLETFGSAYFHGRRKEYVDLHAAVFERVARAAVLDAFERALPKRAEGHDPARVEEGVRAMEEWVKGFPDE
ncbi:MAG: 50S ribosome-binding GTPase [Planctomycetes bacterium]|nr:50S ribosome-binding GTPase [Planctomycetota bacterium]